MDRARATVVFASVLSLGLVLMLFTLAIGAGDTDVGNSTEPWIAGDAILLGIPVAIGAVTYWLLRRTGSARRRAIAFACAVAVGAPLVLLVAFVARAAATS